ncbi:MAG TPA: hypothetical protein VGO86_12295 [Candidatus Dormibacteraeota bacterium]|jgi:uncharacterized membrane protein
MQNPPPGPPPGGQPPSYPPPGGQQPGYPPPGYQPASGVDKKTGAILSYLLWWITGIIFLFVGKNDPDVKFHAAQSTIFFGSISVIGFILNEVSLFTLGGLLFAVSRLLWLFGVVIWIICLIRANGGGGARFQIPWVGGVITPYAEQLANAVN